MDNIEKQIKKLISPRSSETLASNWIGHFPSITPAGEKPNISLEEVVDFDRIAAQLKEQHKKEVDKDSKNKSKEITQLTTARGIRSIVFWEGLFLLHKASHVVSCSEIEIKRGIKTWSLCGAYQGALFGAKAICHLMGVAFPEYDSKTVMIDVWPENPHKPAKAKTPINIDEEPPPIQFTRWPYLFQHQHIWRVFQRLLRVGKIAAWPNDYTKTLADLEHAHFAFQRNHIHYSNGKWIFKDLHTPDVDAGFGNHPGDLHNALVYQIESDFSVALSLAILRLGYLLVEEVTRNTRILDDEKELIKSQFTHDKHPLYLSAHP